MFGPFRSSTNSDKLDIIANNQIDQKVVELFSSQHYSLVENSILPFAQIWR
jgi:hypothetical protein